MPSNEIDDLLSQGLSQEEARQRLARDGYNELPSAGRRTVLAIALSVFREPMFLLLVAGGSIYLLLGEMQEAFVLFVFVFVIMGITFFQERKTERAIEALKDLTSPRASVLRDGRITRIAGREVVVGDLAVLAEGDRVPADALLLGSSNLSVDESLLTGESVPVAKYPSPKGATQEAAGENPSSVYSGTLVVQGMGIARVYAVGARTAIGKIGKSLRAVEEEESFLKRDLDRTVKVFSLSGAALCVLVIIVYGITRADWLNGFLAGLTLGMAIIPEEFPVIFTVFLSLGAWRISRRRVLTRRIPAVETLGATTVLCVDKTGTLTLNRMAIRELRTADGSVCVLPTPDGRVGERFHEVMEYGILASQTAPYDPMEKAIRELSDTALAGTEHLHRDWEMVREYPFSRSFLAMSRAWKRRDGGEYVIAAKGAPEVIADLCHFDDQRLLDLKSSAEDMARKGLRVLGVARATFKPGTLPGIQHDFVFEFQGLIGLADPVREPVPAALQECHQAGIRVIMITGDYPGTALNVAAQAGMNNRETAVTGPELDAMDEPRLRETVRSVNVFARVVPEQKLRIVNALKANGEVVAMTGDGVNDAPALKAAHIGIAMGGRGTDVARESASLVLLDDDFISIVAAVRMGRRIFDNLKKAVAYIFAIHVPIAGLSLIPVLLEWPLILFPVHIAFLQLIIDPSCSLVFESETEERNIMSRPPRSIREPLFSPGTVFSGLLQGIILLGIAAGVYVAARALGEDVKQTRTLSFVALIVGNLGLILSNRSWTLTIPKLMREKNRAMALVFFGAVLFLAAVLSIPFLRDLFLFAPLSFSNIAFCVLAGAVGIALFELVKIVRLKMRKPRRDRG